MKVFNALGSGFRRTVKAWKGVLVIWFFSLIMVSLVALPMKGAMKAAFGKSGITEKLLGGIDIDVIGDMGTNLRSLTNYFSSGLLILVLTGILINAFLTGGLFENLKSRISASDFFRASARNFWSFLGITSIISMIILFLSVIIIGLPVSVASQIESGSEKTPYIITLASGLGFLFIEAILLLVADYARAWQVTKEKASCFKALGFGFSRTFGTFFSSFPMMLIIIIIQIFFSLVVIKIVGLWRPVTGGGVFLMFLASQLLFIVKVLIKTWRYGSVTSLMELNNPAESQEKENLY